MRFGGAHRGDVWRGGERKFLFDICTTGDGCILVSFFCIVVDGVFLYLFLALLVMMFPCMSFFIIGLSHICPCVD